MFEKVKGGFFSESAIRFSKDSFSEYFFWRLGDLKNESHFLKKKPPLEATFKDF